MSSPSVWAVSKELEGPPVLNVSAFLETIPVNSYLPTIGVELIEFGTYLLKMCADNPHLDILVTKKTDDLDLS